MWRRAAPRRLPVYDVDIGFLSTYNGANLRRATAEQAACELAKPADKVTVRVVHRYQRYVQVYIFR